MCYVSFLCLLIGVAVSMVLCISAFRPNGVPYAYIMLFAAAFLYFIRQSLLPNLLKVSKNKQLLIVWSLPVVYMLIHALLFESANLLQYAARNIMSILAGLLILLVTKNMRQFMSVFIGMSSFLILDGLVGVGQYFGFNCASRISEILSGSIDIVRTERIWGVHSHSHMFGYHQGVWTLFVWWVFLVKGNGGVSRCIFLLPFIVGLSATVLSGQRGIIWPIFPLMIVNYIYIKGFSKSIVFVVVAALAFYALDFTFLLDYRGGVVARITDLQISSSDLYRFNTWKCAIKILSEDPFWGTAYSQNANLAIHNALLNGWIRYGILWVILFIFALWRTISYIWLFPTSTGNKISALSIVGIIMFNSMFHTSTPGKNDMTIFIFMGFITTSLYLFSHDEVSPMVKGDGDSILLKR